MNKGPSGRAAKYERRNQYHLLWTHFFKRFLHNDLISPQGETQITLIHILSVLTVPGFLFAYVAFKKYFIYLKSTPTNVRAAAILSDQGLLIAFSMVIIGFLAILEWDALLPERRDFAVLTTLPIRRKTLLGAKVTALLLFLWFFTTAINLFPALVLPWATADQADSLIALLWRIAVHLVSVGVASAFVFFSCVTLHGLLVNFPGRHSLDRVSRAAQSLLLLLLVQALFLLPQLSFAIKTLKQTDSIAAYLPPLWYLGLYQVLLGNEDPVYRSLAGTALTALGLSFAGSLLVYICSFRERLSPWAEAREYQSPNVPRVQAWVETFLNRLMIRNEVGQAIFHFVIKTTLRSHKHRLYLAAYAAVGLAFSGVTTLASAHWVEEATLEQIQSALLPVPLILLFFLLAGMRYIFTIPAELGANWVFQLEANRQPRQCFSGVRKAMLLLALVPCLIFLVPLYLVVWDWPRTLLHLVYCTTIALMLVEVLIFRFPKIPFTCSYLPGKANLRLYWAIYLFAFLMYASSAISLETWMFEHLDRFLVFFVFAFGLLLLCHTQWRHWIHPGFEFVFHEEPEPAVHSLRLNL